MEANSAASPTPDERTLATLAHIFQLFSGFVAPLIIYLAKRDSRFVAFHAVQALIWQGVLTVALITPILLWKVLISATIATNPEISQQVVPPAWFVVVSPIMWLCWGGAPVITLLMEIRYGIKAYQGVWAGYSIIGRWALRLAAAEPAGERPN